MRAVARTAGGPPDAPECKPWAIRGFIPPRHLRLEDKFVFVLGQVCESTEARLRQLGLPPPAPTLNKSPRLAHATPVSHLVANVAAGTPHPLAVAPAPATEEEAAPAKPFTCEMDGIARDISAMSLTRSNDNFPGFAVAERA